jgi:aspartyl protease family protein
MKPASIFGVLAVAAVVAFMAPRDDGAGRQAASLPTSPKAQANVIQTTDWNSGEMILPQNSDGHFYADVTVDGSTAHMLVDTGASVVALTGADAEAMGISWQPEQVRPIARGASGYVYGVEVTLDRVQLGGLEVREVAAIVVPAGLGISLLGQTFLGKIGRVEIADGKMVLGS